MTDTSGPQKIVVGIDGSAPSIDAFRWAVRQAELTGSVVEAVMAWQYLAGVVPAGAQDFKAESRRALDGAIAGTFAGAPPSK
jgi:nucleotide-binding universal stress UspA family protein